MNVYKILRTTVPQFSLVKRNFRTGLRKVQPETPPTANKLRIAAKALGFTTIVGGCSFVGSTIWQYESLRKKMSGSRSTQHSFITKSGSLRNHIHHYWNKLSSGEKLVCGIIALNVGVYFAWRSRRVDRILQVWFLSNPFSGTRHAVYLSMLLSAFSHYSLIHLSANMYVLWTFTPAAIHLLGKEQFFSVYITAAVVSGFASYMNKLIRISSIPSLGASGALMAIVGAICTQYPNAKLSIVFLDTLFPHSFKASDAIKCIVIFDVLGCFLGWKMIDHAAHLGGMFFGIWYMKYGHKYLWDSREPLIRAWHRLRGSP